MVPLSRVGLLIEAIKELKSEVDSLKAEVALLRGRKREGALWPLLLGIYLLSGNTAPATPAKPIPTVTIASCIAWASCRPNAVAIKIRPRQVEASFNRATKVSGELTSLTLKTHNILLCEFIVLLFLINA